MNRPFVYYAGFAEHVSLEMFTHYSGEDRETLEELKIIYPFAVFMCFNYEYTGTMDRHKMMSEISGGGYHKLEETVIAFYKTMEEANTMARTNMYNTDSFLNIIYDEN